jgi:hypothetical protein
MTQLEDATRGLGPTWQRLRPERGILARQNILLRRQIGKVAADTGGAFEEASVQEEDMVDIQTIEEDATEEVDTGSQSEGDTGDVDGTGDEAYWQIGPRARLIEFISNPPD